MASPVNDTYTAASGATVYGGRNVPDALRDFLATMGAGTSKAVPNSDLSSAAYANDTTNAYSRAGLGADYDSGLATEIAGSAGPLAVVTAWSGGDWDSVGRRLLAKGGGHDDYYGSEVYAFNTQAALRWERLTTPGSYAAIIDCDLPILPNGSPCPTHTYETLVYNPNENELIQVGCAQALGGACNSPGTPPYTVALSLTDYSWSTLDTDCGFSVSPDLCVARDPSTGILYAISLSNGLAKFDRTTKTWTSIGVAFGDRLTDYHMVCAIRPGVALVAASRLGNAAGDGPGVNVVDLATGDITVQTVTGDTAWIEYTGPQGQGAPGFVWDDEIQQFVAWVPGSPTIYYVDPDTWVSTAQTITGDTPDAEAANSNGVYGRFQVIPSSGSRPRCYIAFPKFDGNVCIIKPAA